MHMHNVYIHTSAIITCKLMAKYTHKRNNIFISTKYNSDQALSTERQADQGKEDQNSVRS